MNNYTIRRYHSDDFVLWNDFIDHANSATFLFHRDFMEYHAHRFQDHSLMVFNEDVLQAVFPAHFVENQIYSHQGLTYGGFVFRDEITADEISKIIFETLEYLKKLSFEFCVIKEILPFYAPMYFSEIQNSLLDRSAKRMGQKMNLAVPFQSDFKISKSKLKHYRRLQYQDLEVKKEVGFESFWTKVLQPVLSEKYQTTPLHSLEEISLLQSKFPDNIEQYNLYHEGEILAGITLFKTNKVIKSQYGATTESGKKFRALDYLFLYLIERFKDEYHYFDMGTVDDHSELGYNEGLLNQKKELGCSVYSQNIYQIAL